MILSSPVMREGLHIHFRYTGDDVDDGTMPLAEVVESLQGLSGAYAKIASLDGSEVHHQLRVSSIKTGSFEMLILAWVSFAQVSGQLETLEHVLSASRWVLTKMVDVISAKKHTKGKPFTISVKGDNNKTLVIINNEGAEMAMSPESFDIFHTKIIDSDLNKIAAPLHKDEIESAEIVAEGGGEPIEATITSGERDYFQPPESVVTSKEAEITGRLVSLNKENNRGTFRLGNGKGISYHYAGPNPETFHADFGFNPGQVRVRGIASFNEMLEPTHLEVVSIESLQAMLPLESS